MTDREMLELAARAAGIDWFDEPALQAGKGLHMKSGPFWNPLNDDGDALRLAIDLRLKVKSFETGVDVCDEYGDYIWGEYTTPNCCHYAMARRAIVRAAAAIGEKMP